MLPSQQDSNNHYEAPNNAHIQRAYRVESNDTNSQYASLSDAYSQTRANNYSRDNSYTATRAQVSTYPSDLPRERVNSRNNDNESRVVYRDNRFRGADGNSEGFENPRITERPTASNAGTIIERERQVPSAQSRSATATYAPSPIRQTGSSNGRTCVLDISITISTGGQPIINATSDTSRLSTRPTNTTTYDNVRYVDLDLRSPQNTATFTTDGNVRRS